MYSIFVDDSKEMHATLWVLVAIKIFIVFWLIYYIFERRKRKSSVNNLAVTEQGMIKSYAGAPVTQASKGSNESNTQQQLYPNLVPPNMPSSSGIAESHLNVMPIKENMG